MSYKAPAVRSQFYDTDLVSLDNGLICLDRSLTVQSEKEDADINVIVERFGLTGHLPENVRVPQSGDFVAVSDYKSAMDAVHAAQESFMRFPADVRARFDHDPGSLISFVEDPANYDEAVRLGIANARPVGAGGAPVASTASPSPGA